MKITRKMTEAELEVLRKNIETQIFSAFASIQKSSDSNSFKEIKKKNKTDILPFIPLFRVLGKKQLDFVAKKFKLKKYKKGNVLFNYGDASDEVYIIKSGEILLYRDLDGMNMIEYALSFPGDVIGEMGVISGSPRSLSAGVYSDLAEAYAISKDDFLFILKKYPDLSLNLSKILCERIEETNRRLLDYIS
jgi:CRP-like cAMP-binding protein